MHTIKSATTFYPEKNDYKARDLFLKNLKMKETKNELKLSDIENILKYVNQYILDQKKTHQLNQIKALTPTSKEKEIPKAFICPLTHEIMNDPVITFEGHTYERGAIVAWIAKDASCPITRKELHIEQLIPNRAIKQAIETFLKESES